MDNVCCVLLQPLPFNGFMVDDDEDNEDDVMSDTAEDLSVKDPDAVTRAKALAGDDTAKSGCAGLDLETGKVSKI
jgi:hypothetical protein